MKAQQLFQRRKRRNRFNVRRQANGKPRLSVFRSGKHIYAQIIDDEAGRTLASASSVDKELRGKLKSGTDVEAAKSVGQTIAERGSKAGISEVVFDRGGYSFQGRVKALADAAREGGLKF